MTVCSPKYISAGQLGHKFYQDHWRLQGPVLDSEGGSISSYKLPACNPLSSFSSTFLFLPTPNSRPVLHSHISLCSQDFALNQPRNSHEFPASLALEDTLMASDHVNNVDSFRKSTPSTPILSVYNQSDDGIS